MLPFKRGAFHLGIQYHKVIIPVVVRTYYPEYSRSEKRFDLRNIRVRGTSDAEYSTGVTFILSNSIPVVKLA